MDMTSCRTERVKTPPTEAIVTENWHYHQPRSLQFGTGPSPNTFPVPQELRSRYHEAINPPGGTTWSENRAQRSPMSEYRNISRGAYLGPSVPGSSVAYGHARPISPDDQETGDESRYQMHHKDKHRMPIPPKAPRISRLPTPDFDAMDCGKHDVASHSFCACCDSGDSFGMETAQMESAKDKMERQCMPPSPWPSWRFIINTSLKLTY
ncbi:hypothetical protein AAE478_009527 [Parahypoxylon ruwenzoriense]